MNILYSLGTRAYFGAIKVASRCGHRKARQMEDGRRGWADRLSDAMRRLRADWHSPRVAWFHAASLGEFEQGRPIMERLRLEQPDICIVLTFFSPSGYEVRKNYDGADIVSYLPYDTPRNARRFLDIVRPEVAVFVKYEYWGYMLEALDRRDVPTYLVSGIFRRRQAFFRWYGALMRPVLRHFTHFFVQDDESRRLLATLDYRNNVTVCGDTRFDRVLQIHSQAKVLPWADTFVGTDAQRADGSSFTVVAGSTWPPDEELLLDYFNTHPAMKLIIAPHEIHEAHVEQIVRKLKRPYIRYSQIAAADATASPDSKQTAGVDCIIVDAIGFLSSIYRYGDVAYVGGGFGVGIHNTLEAAVYGIPVIFGPNHEAFREAIGLLEVGGGLTIADSNELTTALDRLANDVPYRQTCGSAAGHYVQTNAGATDTIYKAIF